MRKPRSSMNSRLKKINPELEEIELLKSWIEFGRPDPGTNPLSLPPLPSNARTGRLDQNTFSPYAGCKKFHQLPLSKKLKDGLSGSKFTKMTEIQRASLPHSLAGRDILGAAKTGSGKTLAFIIPVLEKLYRLSWGPQDGVGSIIISPTRELACQIFEVLKSVGKHHGFSAGLLIGGHEDVDTEKELVNNMNILVCTPGRLLQHMDETPNFSCDQLQVLVLDEADRILDVGFKKALNAIISQLPKQRQTLLFSATQTKSVGNLARLSLQDPEYISVHEEAQTATPSRLYQTAMVVPLDQKLDMLWSFVKTHLNSRIVVFLSTCKQVKFVFEAFKKLRPGIPLKCLHGRMKQPRRQGIYAQFCEKRSVLFCTDVASRGLDFNKAVDWVVQVDCPENVDAYIHRVGRTARYLSAGRSVLFLMPTEIKILEKLEEKKIPVQFTKVNTKRLQSISGLLAALLVKYKDLQYLAQRAFITYVKAIHKQPDKEIFDVMKLPIDEFSASLGLPMTPKIRFLPQKNKGNGVQDVKGYEPAILIEDNPIGEDLPELPTGSLEKCEDDDEVDNDFLIRKQDTHGEVEKETQTGDILPVTRVSKKKKLKINVHRPAGSRVVFDEEGNTLPPLATIADMRGSGSPVIDKDKVDKRYKEMYEKMKEQDKEDKLLQTQRLKEKRMKDKNKLNRGREEGDDDLSGSDGEETSLGQKAGKRSKIYFDSDNDDGEIKRQKDKMGIVADSISLAQQEELALKLLSSMNK